MPFPRFPRPTKFIFLDQNRHWQRYDGFYPYEEWRKKMLDYLEEKERPITTEDLLKALKK